MTAAVLQWSGGKDSALALHRLRQQSRLSVTTLLTMINEDADRSSWHGIPRETMEVQAAALELPIDFVPVAADATGYVDQMAETFQDYQERGIAYLAVGDIETADPDMPRERAMSAAGLSPFYPLLGESTDTLVQEVIDSRFRAIIVVVDGTHLDRSYLGREVTPALLDELPDAVDVGGERGEYHTFVVDGPPFAREVDITTGEVVTRTVADVPYHYLDVRPG